MGTVYLIHFHRRLHHAGHYLGFCEEDVEQRIERHRNGNGARLMEVVTQLGITWEVVRTWEDVDRKFERKLKKRKKSTELCPICKECKKHQHKKTKPRHRPKRRRAA